MNPWAPFGVKAGSITCPYCRAKAGEWCVNQRTGRALPRAHPERTAAWRKSLRSTAILNTGKPG